MMIIMVITKYLICLGTHDVMIMIMTEILMMIAVIMIIMNMRFYLFSQSLVNYHDSDNLRIRIHISREVTPLP